MLNLDWTNQYKRDLKLVKKRGKILKKLDAIIEILQNEKSLPVKNFDHPLGGDYKNHRECHIEPDWLLIYLKIKNVLILVRTGTHADLFK